MGSERRALHDSDSSRDTSGKVRVAKRGHKTYFIAAIVLSAVVYAATMFMVALSNIPLGRKLGIYHNTTGGIARLYPIEIQPTPATFSIWSAIFIWNGLYIVYMQSTICRSGKQGYYYLYPVIPLAVYIIYWVNSATVVAWTLLWDRQMLEGAAVALFLTSATTYVNIALVARNIYNLKDALFRDSRGREYWLVQAVVLNGLGLYVGWTSVAMMLNLAIVLSYGQLTHVPQATSSTIALVILIVLIVTYIIADVSVLDNYTRYLVSPYISLTAAAVGSVVRNHATASLTNRVLTPILLGIIVVSFIIKVIVLGVRERRHPLLPRPRST